jgi:hypothetical protein
MKVRTSIKAGAEGSYVGGGTHVKVFICSSDNHNEKLMDNNNNSVEGKKNSIKRLRLNKETIRELKESSLKQIAGGGNQYSNKDPLCSLDNRCDSLVLRCGPSDLNHNEKLISDSNGTVESGKDFIKRLKLNKETIRELKESNLKQITGGREGHLATTSYTTCSPTCFQ